MTLIQADLIQSLISEISSIPVKTENDFISLGSFLQTLSKEIFNLVEHTSQSAGLLLKDDNDILFHTESLAGSILHSLERNHEIIDTNIGYVNEIINGLEQLRKYQTQIAHISKYLNAVAFNFEVETSRIGKNGQNFLILSEEIRLLSDRIHKISIGIKTDSDSAGSTFSSTKELIVTQLNQAGKMSLEARTRLSESIRETRDLISLAAAAIEKANRSSRSIHTEIGNIMVAVQMHDNIRQRIEHICHGLRDVNTLCNTEDPVGNGSYTGKERPGLAYKILMIQESQLLQLIKDIESVFYKNHQTFESILKEIDSVTYDLFKAKDTHSNKQVTLGIMNSLERISELKNNGQSMISDVEAVASHTLESSRHLSGYISQVHTISRESQIKSLNAIIAADKLMEEGVTLKVLAHEMRAMTDQIDGFTVHVNQILSSVNITSEKLNQNSSELKNQDSLAESKNITASIQDIAHTFEALHGHMETIRGQGENLKAQTCVAHEELQFIKTMTQTLNTLVQRIKNARSALGPYENSFLRPIEEDSYFLNRYTMEKERNVHKKLSVKDRVGLHADAAKETDELGDNIDLF